MGNLITATDLVADGIALTENLCALRISEAEAKIEQITGFRFYKHTATIKLDGSATELLVLPQPLITLTSITEDGVAVASTDYTLYNRTLPGHDDRLWPRIVKSSANSILWQPDTQSEVLSKWNRGYQNIVIVGDWGFVDAAGDPVQYTTPVEIKRAAVRLTALLAYRAGSEQDRIQLRMSRDIQSMTAASLSVSFWNDPASNFLTGDSVIDDILRRYTHPLRGTRAPFAFGGA